MRWFLFLLWMLLAAIPALADGSDWIIAKPEPVKSAAPIESDWTLDTDGSYVRKISGWSAAKAAASTPTQTRTQSVPAVTQGFPTIPGMIAQPVHVLNTTSPVIYRMANIYTVVNPAVLRGGIGSGCSTG